MNIPCFRRVIDTTDEPSAIRQTQTAKPTHSVQRWYNPPVILGTQRFVIWKSTEQAHQTRATRFRQRHKSSLTFKLHTNESPITVASMPESATRNSTTTCRVAPNPTSPGSYNGVPGKDAGSTFLGFTVVRAIAAHYRKHMMRVKQLARLETI